MINFFCRYSVCHASLVTCPSVDTQFRPPFSGTCLNFDSFVNCSPCRTTDSCSSVVFKILDELPYCFQSGHSVFHSTWNPPRFQLFYLFLDFFFSVAAILVGLKCHLLWLCLRSLVPSAGQYPFKGRGDGSAGVGACGKAWRPDFDPRDLHGRGRELVHVYCSLTSTHVLWHA